QRLTFQRVTFRRLTFWRLVFQRLVFRWLAVVGLSNRRTHDPLHTVLARLTYLLALLYIEVSTNRRCAETARHNHVAHAHTPIRANSTNDLQKHSTWDQVRSGHKIAAASVAPDVPYFWQ